MTGANGVRRGHPRGVTDMWTSSDLRMNRHDRLAFSLEEYRRRYDAVLRGMRAADIEVLLIRTPENICYLTGYETPGYYGYHCLIVALDQDPVLVVRRSEETNAWEFSWLSETRVVLDFEEPSAVMIASLERHGLADERLGIEESAWFTTIEEYKAIARALPEATLLNGSGIVEAVRVVKSEEEIALMRRCARMLDEGIRAGVEMVREGVNENEIAAEVHRVLVGLGSEYPGLPHFILSGERTALCHGTWRGRRVEQGDPVYFELSATRHRYSAAIMLTTSVGEPKDPRVRRFAEAALAGLQATKEAIRPDVPAEEADRAMHAAWEKHGLGDRHFNRAAYSIGLSFPPDWGEGHILSLRRGESRLLEPNMTFHIISVTWIYREFGVGFSATVRVTEDGCEDFSDFPRELLVV